MAIHELPRSLTRDSIAGHHIVVRDRHQPAVNTRPTSRAEVFSEDDFGIDEGRWISGDSGAGSAGMGVASRE